MKKRILHSIAHHSINRKDFDVKSKCNNSYIYGNAQGSGLCAFLGLALCFHIYKEIFYCIHCLLKLKTHLRIYWLFFDYLNYYEPLCFKKLDKKINFKVEKRNIIKKGEFLL